MRTVRAGEPFEAQADNFPPGLAGTIGVRLLDTPAGTVITARTTAGITEQPAGSGLYSVLLDAPETPGTYSVVFDTGGAEPRYAREELDVTPTGQPSIAGPLAGAYANEADLAAYAPGLDLAGADVPSLLVRASAQIDTVLGPLAFITDETSDYIGRKYNPADLLTWEATALARATAAQAEHLRRIDIAAAGVAAAVSAPAIRREKGPDTEVEYAIYQGDATATTAYEHSGREFGPGVRRELGPIAHLRALGGRAAP